MLLAKGSPVGPDVFTPGHGGEKAICLFFFHTLKSGLKPKVK
jgi:hypothetical protein